MGSQSKTNLAYIAGFLDGDGSLMMQIKKRKDGKQKFRFMLTICFYQDSKHATPLKWFRGVISIGYISNRNDHITELRINGYKQVKEIIKKLLPYLKFKKVQAILIYKAASLLESKKQGDLSYADLKKLVGYIVEIQNKNYVTRHKKTRSELMKVLGLTP